MKTLKIVLTSILTLAVLIGGDESRIGTSGGNQVLVPVGARGIAMAGLSGGQSNVIQFITWASRGNAVDFGDDTVAHHRNGACSNAGGGLDLTA